MNIFKAPLHIQILVALIVGAVIGIVMNPGTTQFSDPNSEFTLQAQDGKILIVEEERSAKGELVPVVPPISVIPEQYEKRFDFLPPASDVQAGDVTVKVTERRFRL
ncbi:MAG TPA: hypothetical protein DIW81_01465, partial [Planctomycetaceae bacterium]|nr:hypothetical protein [Planctomycetaceae bacterium]